VNRPPPWVALIGGLVLFGLAFYVSYRGSHPSASPIAIYVLGFMALSVITVAMTRRWVNLKIMILANVALALALFSWILWK
jgi:hypothetical protein